MLYQAVVKELVGLPNVGLVVSLYFVQDCRPELVENARSNSLLKISKQQQQQN